ncbi:TATA box-binding protein-like protein 1 isoform X2 [Copidosoma floridanum]|nr:TATA box-binding protein-like protein 1 isoform X2 [Copidosoma floridanum]XP_014219420.1 TATA box-binding protein-like protein 1 isoform X2 [Copidosoma floridanum]XP_014219421.1 TATA box-binding protein-like protein 1 isoform X2 [Copidosoma floridanum]
MDTFMKNNGSNKTSHGILCPSDNVENYNDSNILSKKGSDILNVRIGSCTEETDDKPELDIIIRNVVCNFSLRCHLNLREIALNGSNVEYIRENGSVRMQLRKPRATAFIYSSGKVTCFRATSEDEAKKAARRCARSLQKLGFNVRFNNYKITNVLGTCTMPWAVKIIPFSVHHKDFVEYEPERHPGVMYKLKDPKASLTIFSTGSINVLADSVNSVQAAVEHIYPLVYEFRKERSVDEQLALEKRKKLVPRIKETAIDENADDENFLVEYDDEYDNSDP